MNTASESASYKRQRSGSWLLGHAAASLIRNYIGIGGLAVSAERGTALQTMALGSCVGVMMSDPTRPCIGMVHIALPESNLDAERAKREPGRFADTGIPALVKAMAKLGAHPERLLVKVAGGAAVLGDNGLFKIGERNIVAVRAVCASQGLSISAIDVGGTLSRTVLMDVDTQRVIVSTPNRDPWEI